MSELLRDRCGSLRDYWYVACLGSALTDRGPVASTILEEDLVLVRDPRGRPRAFRDRCLHRNARLSEGTLDDGCLRCPYHGWTYDPEGRCVEVPAEDPAAFPLPKATLTSFPALERDGLIWVWMGDPARAHTRDPFAMPYAQDPDWGAYYMVTDFDNDVTNCAENFMDVPHTVYVHKGWFRSQSKTKIHATVERTPDSVLVTYEQPQDSIGFTGRILNPSGAPMVHTDKFYMPNVTRVDYHFGGTRSFLITSQCTPVSDMRTRVYTLISFRLGHSLLNTLGRWLLPPYTRQVIHQDVVIMANQGRSLERYGPSFLNSPCDVLHRYIESLRERATQNLPPPEPTSSHIDFFV